MTRPRVLISAYACEPGKGSEPGIGWNWVEQAAAIADLWVITRVNNRPAIAAACAVEPLSRIRWVYYDLPAWMRWWKRGPRGLGLYYPLWQLGAFLTARRLHAVIGFDRTHHVTIGNYWLPTFLNRLPVPFIWGPVGGGESTPAGFYRAFSPGGRLREHARDLFRRIGEALPSARATARQSVVALATTNATAAHLRRIGAVDVRVLSHTALPECEFERLRQLPLRDEATFRFVSIGRMLHWKGFHLGLAAFGSLDGRLADSEYWFIGDGPERPRLERLAAELGISAKVRFFGNVPREQALARIAECDVLVHPSFHDSGGYVCVEAMAAGRPVICLDTGGPALLVTAESGIRIALHTPERVQQDLADAMARLGTDRELRLRLADGCRRRVHDGLLWQQKRAILRELYSQPGPETQRAGRP